MDPETIDQLVNVGIRLRTHQSANVGEPPEERVEHQLRRLMACVADVTIDISEDLREVMRGYNGTQNTFGESQIKLDVLADHRLMKHLEQETSFQVRQLASEESDEIKTLSTGDVDEGSCLGLRARNWGGGRDREVSCRRARC